jgi:hypothetical protein
LSALFFYSIWCILTGKNYDIVSFAAQESNATVFLSSASEPNVVGKISRLVSLVHYPEPDEIQKLNSNNLRQIYEKSRGSSLINSSRQFSIQSSILRNSQTRSSRPTSTHSVRPTSTHSSHPTSTHSSRQRSSLSEVGEPSKPSKRKHVRESTGSMEHSTQDSGRDHSAVTTSGSSERSHKSKKRVKNEE